MSGFKNDVVFAKNADFSAVNNTSPAEANGLFTDGQIWTGSTAVNVGGTHVNVGMMTSPDGSITFGYSAPNITAVVNSAVIQDLHITPYIVSAAGIVNGASYSTIQSALDAASISGGIVYVQPGTYTENLTLYANTEVVGTPGNSDAGTAGNTVIISGVHTPPATGSFTFANVRLASATHIFSSAAAGSAALILENCFVAITNGFIFNLANWTGDLVVYNLGDGSTNNGVVTNAGGSTCFFISATLGAGTGQTMSTTGTVVMQEIVLNCPWSAATGTTIACDYVIFSRAVTAANNSTGTFNWCRFSPGAVAAFTMSSSGSVAINNSIVNSSNNPAIAGAGAGTLTLADVTFLDNQAFAATVNLASKATFLRTPIYTNQGASTTVRLNSGSFVTATSTLTTPPTTGLSDGDLLEFVVTNGTLTIQLAATQVAHVGSLTTSAAGTITSTLTGDTIILRYQVSTNDWWATSVIGTWLIA